MEDIAVHLSPLSTFSIVVGFFVLLPKLMDRCRLPAVLGFIVAGTLVGPSGFGLIQANGPVVSLFAELGKLLFMFFVGFEIDLDGFKQARNRSLTFGALTFFLPFVAGAALGRLTGSGWNSALLIGSLIASHTLLAFPALQRHGLAQHPSVTTVVGGTIFTDIASMLVLAVAVSVHRTGFSWQFLGAEVLELAVFVPLVLFGAGTVARKAIIRYGARAEVRVMILLVVITVCSEGANLIKLEGIVGAFLAGIAVKRAVRGGFVVEQLDVVARALFIPAFFLTTGFLVNFRLLGHTAISRPILVLGIIGALLGGKFLAAWFTKLAFGGTRAETALVWSLSLPQMAATLASAVVGYQTVNAAGERLLDESWVNAVLVLVVATCVGGPILTERFAQQVIGQSGAHGDSSPDAEPADARP